MTGPEHYRLAERCITAARTAEHPADIHAYLAEAHTHALLAVAAATGLNDAVTGLPMRDRDAWQTTAGTGSA